ncbi:MAG: hypothetical protein KDA60_17785, partial [Planctomycetales bacterium]|nr:hypothetical protein [Planctomycetales bacterium]
MSARDSRRRFLQHAAWAGGGLLTFPELSALTQLGPVCAAETSLPVDSVQFTPDIEPLVRLLEETPRDDVIGVVARRIQTGLSYRELVAALLLAGVRNVQPRPSVGFKFHAVLVVNSAHLASLASPDEDRWLPILWAIDNFKGSQSRDVEEGNWTMAAVDESAVPDCTQAHQVLTAALEAWDESAADVAVAGLTRTAGATELFEILARYGVRDFRSIGHKAIFVANSWRTLQCIGWRYAEPVMRSLVYALLNHEGEPNPADADLQADRPYRYNLEKVQSIGTVWQRGKRDDGATRDLLSTLREGSWQDASDTAARLLTEGISPQSIYDALHNGAGELLIRQPGIVGLHTVTTTNAMHYLHQQSADPKTRALILLQNAAFLPLFREAMRGRGNVADVNITELSVESDAEPTSDTLANIFTQVSSARDKACHQTLGYLNEGGDPEAFIKAARQLIFLKG